MSYYTERDDALGQIEQAERDLADKTDDPVMEEARKIAEAQGNDPRKWNEYVWLARRLINTKK